ncbi:SGNH/GDSL hydrolase family protein [Nocardioides pocheonensis]|uniref:Lipase n=1 Tax=Nocardioides pocheonensis TaxID=661485 RepID=A0A3N0GVU0_9ACTN|nr:SGNH/GDSL hydrolase family protein [Nocardioides pocheonensis]RNM16583.1 lipase [Nocardioides pocheonensis]
MDRPADLIATPLTADVVRGALELEPTERGVLPHRLPARARRYADPQLTMVEAQPSGVRLALRTRATYLRLETIPTKQVYVGAPPRPDGVYELVVDGARVAQATADGGDTLTLDLATGAVEATRGSAPAVVEFGGLPDRDKTVEVWLPWNERTELVALWTDAPAGPVPGTGLRRWVHHGSSISHGSNAAGPTSTWPALAAAQGGVDLVNLGFGGSALLDPFVARVIRDTDADLISLKIGINLVNTDLMRVRAFTPAVHGFLDTIRDGHPETPLLVVSPIGCPIHESTPGPSEFDPAAMAAGEIRLRAAGDAAEVPAGKLTLQVVRAELARIVQERSPDDPHLGHLDGLDLYGGADTEEHPLPDNLHPDAATQRLIGERFAARAFGEGGLLHDRMR